jgi:hypothetical protein
MAIAQTDLLLPGGGFGGFPTDVVLGGVAGIELLPYIPILLTSASGYETSQELVLPAGAVVTQAAFTVAARAPEFATHVGDIASVRASKGTPTASSDELVVDFGVLRTVSSINGPSDVNYVSAWRGTQFDLFVAEGNGTSYLEFTEVQTERLLVGLAASVSPASFGEGATVTTTTPPADLELLVAGERAWNRAGPAPEGFSEDVDVTATLQAALTSIAPDADGNVHVPVVLRARVPGTLALGLAQPVSYLRTHTVAFPGGATASRTFAEEGVLDVELPLPADAAGWIVHRVLATVIATDDTTRRVLPPVGPDASAQAELVLDPDRRLVVRVPAERFAPFELLEGVRVRVQPQAGGVELSGALLADAERAHETDPPLPGDPVTRGTFTPVTLDEADGEPAFVTLELPQPLKLAGGTALWFSLAATRGKAVVGLAAAGEAAPAELRRVMPNGAIRELSAPTGVDTGRLQLRVAGVAPEVAPIDIVQVDLTGGPTAHEPVADAELAAAGLVSLAVDPPAPRPGLALRLTATAATTVTVGPVVVAYTEPPGGSP